MRIHARADLAGLGFLGAALRRRREVRVEQVVRLAGPNDAVEIFGVRLVGVTAENATKLLFTVVFVVALVVLGRVLRWALAKALGQGRAAGKKQERARFWSTQGVHLLLAAVMVLGIISIWFDDPGRFAMFGGLFSAGIAFALQRVITAFAGYFVILRGKTFNVGDRITMGSVHGDVVALGFMQTTIMEMGQPPAVNEQERPGMWVRARQYSGRIVTVTNDKIFDEPVYNYTREFPFIWEEMTVPVGYKSDRERAERILLEAARRHTVKAAELSEAAIRGIERRYYVSPPEMTPRVYLRLTDNWVELTVRFIVKEHGIREVKDAMSREVLGELERAGIEVASSTYDIVGFPPVRVEVAGVEGRRDAGRRAGEEARGEVTREVERPGFGASGAG